MKKNRMPLAALVLAFAASGCALVPKENVRLEEARAAQATMRADSATLALAPAAVRRADEAFESAIAASNTLQDPALVDHLAYVARQRAAIAVETAKRIAADRSIATPLHQTSGRPR